MLSLDANSELKSNPIRARAMKILKMKEPDTLISKNDYGFLVTYFDGSEEWFF